MNPGVDDLDVILVGVDADVSFPRTVNLYVKENRAAAETRSSSSPFSIQQTRRLGLKPAPV